jgi:hypothetical protein
MRLLNFEQPTAAVVFGWIIAMWSRQIGHFFFEPKGYDEVNQTSHEYKEAIKVGYNLRRKVVLMSMWAVSPLLLYLNSSFLGFLEPHTDWRGIVDNLARIWLSLAIGALLFRTLHLFKLKGVQSGLVWMTKILTDPFNDIKQYYKVPLYLLRREMLDPMTH